MDLCINPNLYRGMQRSTNSLIYFTIHDYDFTICFVNYGPIRRSIEYTGELGPSFVKAPSFVIAKYKSRGFLI